MTGSQSAKKELSSVGIKETQVTVVPHGVLLDLPKRKIKKESVKTVIFLGALAKDKGIEDALKCFAILNKNMKVNFWVVGGGDKNYLKFLKKKAHDLGVEVKFLGGRDKVNDKKKFELLSRAHIMVNPSVREGWGLVNIEANSVGTPVVAYRSVGLIDSVKHGVSGIICEENTPDAMARVISGLLNDKKAYEKLKSGAISWSKRFSWKHSREMSIALIKKIVI